LKNGERVGWPGSPRTPSRSSDERRGRRGGRQFQPSDLPEASRSARPIHGRLSGRPSSRVPVRNRTLDIAIEQLAVWSAAHDTSGKCHDDLAHHSHRRSRFAGLRSAKYRDDTNLLLHVQIIQRLPLNPVLQIRKRDIATRASEMGLSDLRRASREPDARAAFSRRREVSLGTDLFSGEQLQSVRSTSYSTSKDCDKSRTETAGFKTTEMIGSYRQWIG
jgi:hypothetical protein